MSDEHTARRHLEQLAAKPRPAGTAALKEARDYCASTLRATGFQVREHTFEYSQLPGRFGTPLVGTAALLNVLVASAAGRATRPGLALALLLVGLGALLALARWAARDGVLSCPWLRARGCNLVAVRHARPKVWLVAHLDSKSQPVPMLARIAGIGLLVITYIGAVGLACVQLAGGIGAGWAGAWSIVGIVAALAGAPVAASVVGQRSSGAVDDASGVVAVLMAASELPNDASIGVLLTDAEELGLAGARAWTRDAGAPSTALNCDGVDDEGDFVVMHSGSEPLPLTTTLAANARAAGQRLRIRHLFVGALVDAVAMHDARWQAVTLSRGTLATLGRVHTAADDLRHLNGTAVPVAARLLARTAMDLC